ncbi:sporulation integral membrane protein YlbJ [Halalkalibacterium ligniniphilum]|uniref:sporulation integral membrane protein YlbJ n=1 Tax=Halalkalibacterium ligniniphilum TaxID=1134413 RepID=UPI000349DE73|nr:sporulation integral membrane protein YlbJ [Halalkalibacterium ligniniphilum]
MHLPFPILKTLLFASFASFLAVSLMIFPKESLEASTLGLQMWWNVVFPSLLPFFIVSELLIGFGVVSFLGMILEPLMRPLFRVPGVGGFVWAMGLASGYPAGAKLTARMRQEKKLSRIEAERLVSFTNSSNPLFIFGAISIGFFQNAALGILLALSHYFGNICVGLMMRFHGRREESVLPPSPVKRMSIKKAIQLMHNERLKDGRPLGQLLGDAVRSSIQTLLMVGGFIILFSVLNRILSLVGLTELLAAFFSIILAFFQLPNELSTPLLSGLFEITLGAQMTSQVESASLLQQVIVTSFFLAFCGFSVQAQVASILAETDIRFKPFFVARLMHGFFAAGLTIILWKPLYEAQQGTESSIHSIPTFFHHQASPWFNGIWDALLNYGSYFTLFMVLLFVFLRAHHTLKK